MNDLIKNTLLLLSLVSLELNLCASTMQPFNQKIRRHHWPKNYDVYSSFLLNKNPKYILRFKTPKEAYILPVLQTIRVHEAPTVGVKATITNLSAEDKILERDLRSIGAVAKALEASIIHGAKKQNSLNETPASLLTDDYKKHDEEKAREKAVKAEMEQERKATEEEFAEKKLFMEMQDEDKDKEIESASRRNEEENEAEDLLESAEEEAEEKIRDSKELKDALEKEKEQNILRSIEDEKLIEDKNYQNQEAKEALKGKENEAAIETNEKLAAEALVHKAKENKAATDMYNKKKDLENEEQLKSQVYKLSKEFDASKPGSDEDICNTGSFLCFSSIRPKNVENLLEVPKIISAKNAFLQVIKRATKKHNLTNFKRISRSNKTVEAKSNFLDQSFKNLNDNDATLETDSDYKNPKEHSDETIDNPQEQKTTNTEEEEASTGTGEEEAPANKEKQESVNETVSNENGEKIGETLFDFSALNFTLSPAQWVYFFVIFPGGILTSVFSLILFI